MGYVGTCAQSRMGCRVRHLHGLPCQASAPHPALQGKPLLVLSGGVQQEAAPQILTVALLPHDGKVNLSSLQVTGESSCVVMLAWHVCSVQPGHPGWPGATRSCACFSKGLPLQPLHPSNAQEQQAECVWLQTAQLGGAA